MTLSTFIHTIVLPYLGYTALGLAAIVVWIGLGMLGLALCGAAGMRSREEEK